MDARVGKMEGGGKKMRGRVEGMKKVEGGENSPVEMVKGTREERALANEYRHPSHHLSSDSHLLPFSHCLHNTSHDLVYSS